MGITFTGERGVATYRAIVIKHGLQLWLKAKIKPNRAWTPSAMLLAASSITRKDYKRGQYQQAIDDLQAWIDVNGTAEG